MAFASHSQEMAEVFGLLSGDVAACILSHCDVAALRALRATCSLCRRAVDLFTTRATLTVCADEPLGALLLELWPAVHRCPGCHTLTLQSVSVEDTLARLSGPQWPDLCPPSVQHLLLSRFDLRADGMAALVGSHGPRQPLQSLQLSKCRVGREGAAALAAEGQWPSLRVLALEQCAVGAEGAAAIAAASWPCLEVRRLCDSQFF